MGDDQPAVRVIDHDGDAALEIDAADEAGCLRGAVWGLASLAGVAGAGPAAMAERRILVAGSTPVERLVGLIDHAIALIDVEGLAPMDAQVAVGGDHADVGLAVAAVDPGEVAAPPKAATWHGVACEATGPERWHARILIDR